MDNQNDLIKNLNDLVNGQIQRRVTFLSVSFLEILEEFLEDGVINQEYYDKMRGRIFDKSGGVTRELQTMINSLDISFKK